MRTEPIEITPELTYRLTKRMYFQGKGKTLVIVSILGALVFFALFLLVDTGAVKAFALALAVFFPCVPFLMMWRIRKVTRSKESEVLYQPVVYTFGEEMISWDREDGSGGRVRWETLKKVDRQPDYFLLHLSTSGSLYIPHDAMPDPEVYAALENALARVGLLKNQ